MRALYGGGALLLCGLLFGCGGGGGGTTALAVSTSMRMLQVGDQWIYNVTGQQTPPGGPTNPVTGTITMTVVQQAVNGRSFLALSRTVQLNTGAGGPLSSSDIRYIIQDPVTQTIKGIAVQDGTATTRISTNNPHLIIYPGSWSATTALAYTIDFDDTSTDTHTLTVSGSEVVNTPVADFTAWKATVTDNDSAIGVTNGTEWWAPQLGAPIKSSLVQTSTTGTRLSLNATLASTNVPVS